MNGPGKHLIILAVISTIVSACGHRERDEDATFEEKKCGTTSDVRTPDPAVSDVSTALSATAFQKPDGDLTVILNPVVDQSSQSIATEIRAEDIQIQCGATPWSPTAENITRVKPDKPAKSDIVFVLDTSGSMIWAINGVINGVMAFADAVTALGIDTMIGGVEFGDEIRTSQTPVAPAEFKVWADKLGELGGGDGPENPIDSMIFAYKNFTFRRDAQKYFIVITDIGFHEKSDGSECSDYNLADAVSLMKGNVLFGVIQAGTNETGVSPKKISSTMGGFYMNVNINPFDPKFNIAEDTQFDGFLENTHQIEVPATACARDPSGADPRTSDANLSDTITVTYKGIHSVQVALSK